MSDFDRHEKILAKGKRRLVAAMIVRGLPAILNEDSRPYGTMRSAWLSTFPKRRGRAFSASDAPAKMWGADDDLEALYVDSGGEG